MRTGYADVSHHQRFLVRLKTRVQVISISIGSNPREGTDQLPWDVQEQIGQTTFVEEECSGMNYMSMQRNVACWWWNVQEMKTY